MKFIKILAADEAHEGERFIIKLPDDDVVLTKLEYPYFQDIDGNEWRFEELKECYLIKD